VTTAWVKENLNNPDVRFVDVRSKQEYTGEIRPFGERRPGHIPGAVNIPLDSFFTPDFKLIAEADLETLLSDAGFADKDQTIILYDTLGVRGAFATMAFRLAGYVNARNYDASYQAWNFDAETQIVQGPNPLAAGD
jgi:3-mercaptopyruvate sulfurtransferase SseA